MSTIEQAVSALHDSYVEAVNIAVADDDYTEAHRLAAEFDVQVLETIRQRLAAA